MQKQGSCFYKDFKLWVVWFCEVIINPSPKFPHWKGFKVGIDAPIQKKSFGLYLLKSNLI